MEPQGPSPCSSISLHQRLLQPPLAEDVEKSHYMFKEIHGNFNYLLLFFLSLTSYYFPIPDNWIGGSRNPKPNCWPIFFSFQVILKNFDFFHLWQKKIVCPQIYFFFWGGGVKKSKTRFRPIFSPFQAILNNFDFFIFDKFFLYALQFFLGGG